MHRKFYQEFLEWSKYNYKKVVSSQQQQQQADHITCITKATCTMGEAIVIIRRILARLSLSRQTSGYR